MASAMTPGAIRSREPQHVVHLVTGTPHGRHGTTNGRRPLTRTAGRTAGGHVIDEPSRDPPAELAIVARVQDKHVPSVVNGPTRRQRLPPMNGRRPEKRQRLIHHPTGEIRRVPFIGHQPSDKTLEQPLRNQRAAGQPLGDSAGHGSPSLLLVVTTTTPSMSGPSRGRNESMLYSCCTRDAGCRRRVVNWTRRGGASDHGSPLERPRGSNAATGVADEHPWVR